MSAQPPRIERLRSYLEADPGNLNLLRDIAREGMLTGQFESALKALDALSQQGASDANDEAAAIHALLKLGQVSQASDRADAAFERWPQDEAVRVEAARAWLNSGRNEDVLLACEPPFVEPIIDRMAAELHGQALWRLTRLEDALAFTAAAVARHSDDARLLALHSALQYDDGKMGPAFETARRARALSPQHAYLALHVLASACLMRQDVAGAQALIDEALANTHQDGRIWLLKGSTEMLAGQFDAAMASLREATQIFPDHPGSHLTLAWLQLLQGNLDVAEEIIQRAIEVSPAFAESHGTLAVIHARRGHREDAERCIRRATLLDRDGFAARYAQKVLDGTATEDVSDLLTDLATRVQI